MQDFSPDFPSIPLYLDTGQASESIRQPSGNSGHSKSGAPDKR